MAFTITVEDWMLTLALRGVAGAVALLVGASLIDWLRPGKSLKGKLVVVTGAASGLGRETAFELARQGARLALWDINREQMEATTKEVTATGAEARCYSCDISQAEKVYESMKKVTDDFKTEVDVLINNAGIVSGKPLLETPDSKIQMVFNVNVLAHFWTVKAVLPAMMKRNQGHIVCIASAVSFTPAPQMVDYSASKFAARGMTLALQTELIALGSNVQTSCICPGAMQTEMFKGFSIPGIPAMSPAWVAKRIVQAIRKEERIVRPQSPHGIALHSVIEPLPARFGVLSQALMPQRWYDAISAPAVKNAMKSFDAHKANSTFTRMDSEKKAT